MNTFRLKFDRLLKMKQFPENHKLSKFNQDEIDNPNSPITITEIDVVIKNLPQKKFSDLDSFTR